MNQGRVLEINGRGLTFDSWYQKCAKEAAMRGEPAHLLKRIIVCSRLDHNLQQMVCERDGLTARIGDAVYARMKLDDGKVGDFRIDAHDQIHGVAIPRWKGIDIQRKGDRWSECYRSACTRRPAVRQHKDIRTWYCERCARDINEQGAICGDKPVFLFEEGKNDAG